MVATRSSVISTKDTSVDTKKERRRKQNRDAQRRYRKRQREKFNGRKPTELSLEETSCAAAFQSSAEPALLTPCGNHQNTSSASVSSYHRSLNFGPSCPVPPDIASSVFLRFLATYVQQQIANSQRELQQWSLYRGPWPMESFNLRRY